MAHSEYETMRVKSSNPSFPESTEFRRFADAVQLIARTNGNAVTVQSEDMRKRKKRLSKGASLDPAVSAIVRSFVERS